MVKKPVVSIVIPVCNEEKNLPLLYCQLKRELIKLNQSYEIVFIDDGSFDSSLAVLKGLRGRDKKVKIISFRRNFGKAAALLAGFREARGKTVLTLDADLQDRPDQIPKFLKKLAEGYDLVCGWRYQRKDSPFKIFTSSIFNKITATLTRTHLHDVNCGFKVFTNDLAKGLKIYGELHRFIPILAKWQGFKVGEVRVKHSPRKFGDSKFGPERFLSGFFDLLTVMFLTRYISKPLHIFGLIGLVSSFSGGSIILFFALRKYLLGVLIGAGRPIIQIAVFLMIFGVQVFIFGLLAEMIISSRDQDSSYLIKEKIG